MAALLGTALVVPAAAQRYNRGGEPTPAPATPTPPPSTPTPAPAPPPPPPPAPVYSTPLLLGQASAGQTPTLQSVFSSLSSQIANYNNSNTYDLSQATLSKAKTTVVSTSSSASSSSASSSSSSGSRYSRGGATEPTPVPTPPPAPVGPTSISVDVTGWSYLVLQWGNTNYHFYVGDATGMKTFSGLAPLSSYTFFSSAATTAVPETLSTFAALGLAAALMGAAARRWGRKQ